ncbi:hypothetical protein HQQ81_05450 [Microbacteriaceae bacterium VKM Ac-2854]|nr:hypothetical protein [Microbacteriaceae bacterium VKM Ac-2854]
MRVSRVAACLVPLLLLTGCSVARPSGPDADLPIGCSQANISTTWGAERVGAGQSLAALSIAQVDDDGVGAPLTVVKSGRFAMNPTVRGDVEALRHPDWPSLLTEHWSSISGEELPEFPLTVTDEFGMAAPARQTGRYLISLLVIADVVPFTVRDCRGDTFASGALVIPAPDRGMGGLVTHCDPTEIDRAPASLSATLTEWCAASLSDGG